MLRLFFTALMFYTRLPVPASTDHDPTALNRATVFFPLIGWIVGGLAAAAYGIGTVLFPTHLAILLSIIVSILVTGAFHEDGFGDVCDGFGGGWNKAQILTIMKDSRLGTYGFVGLGLLLATKFLALQTIAETEGSPWTFVLIYLAGHSVSRFMAITVIKTMTYAREDDEATGKAKPVAQGLSNGQFLLAAVLGLLPLVGLVLKTELWIYLTFLLPLWLARTYLARLYQRWIGGYTGDGLGAVQQLTEVVFYLSFVSIKWISL